jgi:hypothetical protein
MKPGCRARVVGQMDMPDLKPIAAPRTRSKWPWIAGLVAFVVIVFAFAFWINIPEWR